MGHMWDTIAPRSQYLEISHESISLLFSFSILCWIDIGVDTQASKYLEYFKFNIF